MEIVDKIFSILEILDESFPFYNNEGTSWEDADDDKGLHGSARHHYYKTKIEGKYYYSLRNGRSGIYFYLSLEDAINHKECSKKDIVKDVINSNI